MTVETDKMRTDSTEELKGSVGLRHPMLLYGPVGNQADILYTVYPKMSKHLCDQKQVRASIVPEGSLIFVT